jgi:hypothetical protein
MLGAGADVHGVEVCVLDAGVFIGSSAIAMDPQSIPHIKITETNKRINEL